MSAFNPKPFGKYFLVEKIATGGMAEIYKAKTFGVDGFEKHLVIKKILPHCSADKEFIHMLIDEAKLSVLLSHTNIVQVYDLGKVGNDYFISMEFIDGCNLRELVNRSRELNLTLPTEIIIYIGSEIAKGLDYAHHKKDNHHRDLNIVHRDVSPQNILISYEGEVKIVDFGIAKAAMNIGHTLTGMLKGKVSYMSPEQALGKPLDGRTDIFSAGTLLYEMLTGEKLFTGESQIEVLKKIYSTPVTDAVLGDKVPADLKPILLKALAYRPEDRYETAGDLQLALTKHLYSSYQNFSPRQLSALLRIWFEQELRARKERGMEELQILDSKTQTTLMDSGDEENLVHRNESELSQRSTRKQVAKEKTLTKAARPTKQGSELSEAETDPHIFQPENKKAVTLKSPEQTISDAPASRRRRILVLVAALFLTAMAGATAFYRLQMRTRETPPQEEKVVIPKTAPPAVAPPVVVPPPEPPPPSPVDLRVESTPPSALVSVNGAPPLGETPLTLTGLLPNQPYRLTFTKPLYQAEERIFTPSSDPSAPPLQVALTPVKRVVAIESTPSEAEVFVNGEAKNLKTPATIDTLSLGSSYEIKVVKEKFKDATQTLILDENSPETSSLSFTLEAIPEKKIPPKETPKEEKPVDKKPIETPTKSQPPKPASGPPGEVSVSSSPSEADVYMNGILMGKTPGTFSVGSGTIELTIHKEGLAAHHSTFTLGANEKKKLSMVNLAQLTGKVRIDSIPRGAVVLFNGERAGNTPVLVRGVSKEESYSIEVKYSGFKTWTKTITLTENSMEIMADLEKN